MRVLLVGVDANDQNLLQRGPFYNALIRSWGNGHGRKECLHFLLKGLFPILVGAIVKRPEIVILCHRKQNTVLRRYQEHGDIGKDRTFKYVDYITLLVAQSVCSEPAKSGMLIAMNRLTV
jgi:hypothetical protein